MRQLAFQAANKLTAGRNLNLPEERYRLAAIAGWFSVVGNLLLAAIKAGAGLVSGSIALLADAVHTASDISSSLAVLLGYRLSRKEPDLEHPFGHGRIEYFAALVIAFMLVGAGITFIFAAYQRLQTGSEIRPGALSIGVVLFSILFKHFMYLFSLKLGNLIESEALIGDAWHHRSDSLSSSGVLVALLGGYVNLHWLDGVFGFLVALLVIYAGLSVARNACSRLLGKALEPAARDEIINSAREVEGVIDAHDLEVHDYGFLKSMTLHIEVDGELSVTRGHEIAQAVERHISKQYSCNTVVHLDPCKAKGKPDRKPAGPLQQ